MSPTRSRFAQAVRADPVDLALACVLVGGEVDPGLSVDAALRDLDGLAAAARRHVPQGAGDRDAALGLARVLGGEAGFAHGVEDFSDVRSSLLHEVLRRRRGLPITLSVVWAEVGRRLGLDAAPVALPGRVVVRVGGVHADPAGGGALLGREQLDALVRSAGAGPLRPEHLRDADPVDLLLRLLTNVRVLAARGGPDLSSARTRLWAVELSLLLPRHPLDLRRERGELLVRLGDFDGGADELSTWAGAVADADPEAAEQARRAARLARARLN